MTELIFVYNDFFFSSNDTMSSCWSVAPATVETVDALECHSDCFAVYSALCVTSALGTFALTVTSLNKETNHT